MISVANVVLPPRLYPTPVQKKQVSRPAVKAVVASSKSVKLGVRVDGAERSVTDSGGGGGFEMCVEEVMGQDRAGKSGKTCSERSRGIMLEVEEFVVISGVLVVDVSSELRRQGVLRNAVWCASRSCTCSFAAAW